MPLRPALGRPVRALLARAGYKLVKREIEPSDQKAPRPVPADFDPVMAEIVEQVRPYTMTPPDRIGALCLAIRYLEAAGVEGDIVECGTWRGGSLMTAALSLLSLDRDDRDIVGFDTFGLMPDPTDRDVTVFGTTARSMFEGPNSAHLIPELSNVPKAQVLEHVRSTGYPPERIRLVQGMVENTVPGEAPERIALLRLDTDFYESTKHEMQHLFPRIVDGGVLIVDDYGLFQGAREAVDEYLADAGIALLLARTDFAGRIAVIRR